MNDYTLLEGYLKNFPQIKYKKDANLAVLSSFRIGGPADYAIWPLDKMGLCALISFLETNHIRYRVFGNGTNVLFDDDGFRGVAVFTTNLKNISFCDNTMTAECGVPVTYMAQEAAKKGLSGLEFMYGIPGSCGGAVYMNAGAYDCSVDLVLKESLACDWKGNVVSFEKEEHAFGYRHSIYKENGMMILEASFDLAPEDPNKIKERMKELMSRRISRQPLDYPNAGSIFKRPLGHYAGALIEKAGLKGYTIGGAQVSQKHAGFIINTGKATSGDVQNLISHIKECVFNQFGVSLECEIQYIEE